MKSSPGFRVIVAVTALCTLPFHACTNDDLDFTAVGGAGGKPVPHAGASGSGVAGNPGAGFGADVGDAGAGGVSGDAGEAGASGSSGAGGSGNGGMPNAGADQGGSSGQGGVSGGAGGSAGRAGAGQGGAGQGGAGQAGVSGGGGTAGALAICGNALLDPDEQCDDGNSKNLDACNNSCSFEQSQRANSIEQKFRTSSWCPRNAFGGAFEGSAQNALQALLNQRVADGSLSLLLAFRALNDLTGTSSAIISLGLTYGTPSLAPNYDGKSDLDWWYTPAAGQVNLGELSWNSPASFSEGVMNANPGSIWLPLLSDLPLSLSSTKLRLYVGVSSAPLASVGGVAPGHLPSEHLRPGLVSFASSGGPPAGNGDPGQLCANISAASLSALSIPAAYAAGGSSRCLEGYAATRSFLDLLVNGCTLASEDEVVLPTQPDQADPDLPQAGAGAPYRLISNPTSHAVTSCRDRNNRPVSLATCLKSAAYSSSYRLKTGRVIIK